MDVQILPGIVIVHVKGDVKVHAAQGIYQLADRLPLHHDIEVGIHAGELAHLLFQRVHAVFHPLRLRQIGGAPVTGIYRIEPLLSAS